MKIQYKDIIATALLAYCMYLIGIGVNHVVSGIAIMVTTYYFSKRLYEEKHRK